MSNRDEMDYVVKNIDKMVVKKTDGSGGYGMLMGTSASEKEILDYIKKSRLNLIILLLNLL